MSSDQERESGTCRETFEAPENFGYPSQTKSGQKKVTEIRDMQILRKVTENRELQIKKEFLKLLAYFAKKKSFTGRNH